MTFKRRTEPPTEPNANYFSYRNVYYKCLYGMPNCTCYALGRYHEICGVWLPVLHNAEDWAADIAPKGYIIHPTPVLGAVAIWKVGKVGNGKDGAGHVAVVEAIKPNADIITSNSGYYRCEPGVLPKDDKRYQQVFWYEATVKAKNGYNYKSNGREYKLIGFVYPSKWQSEPRKTYVVRKNGVLQIEAGKIRNRLTDINKNDKFKYDGAYKVVDGQKWLHGLLVKANGQKPDLAGWMTADCA